MGEHGHDSHGGHHGASRGGEYADIHDILSPELVKDSLRTLELLIRGRSSLQELEQAVKAYQNSEQKGV